MHEALLLLLGGLLLCLMVLSYIIGSFGLTALFGAPYVRTRGSFVREALQRVGMKQGETVSDIGCGDAMALYEAAQAGAGKVIGYEINPVLAMVARFRLRNVDAEIHRGNMFQADIIPTDIVYLYLLPRTMDRLRPKLAKLPPKTRIVSRGFPFSGVIPFKSIRIQNNTFHIYRAIDL